MGLVGYSSNNNFEAIIERILAKMSSLTREKLLDMVEEKMMESGGLLNREGAAFLVATDLGASLLEGEKIETRMKIKDVIPSLRDLTLFGRVLLVYPVREFIRPNETKGRVQTVLIGDDTAIIEVFLWNDRVEELEKQNIQQKNLIKLEHGYSKKSVYGKTELHVGDRGRVTLVSSPLAEQSIPPYESFLKKIQDMGKDSKEFSFTGTVVKILPSKQFRRVGGEGKVQRLRVGDETGEVNIVVWDDKVKEVESVKVGDQVEVVRGEVKENMLGELEVHAGKRSQVKIIPSKVVEGLQSLKPPSTKISKISPGMRGLVVEGFIKDILGIREAVLRDGSKAKVVTLSLKDETGEIKLSAWRSHAETLSKLPKGVKVRLVNVFSKLGFNDNVELTTVNSTFIELSPNDE